ncbi:hypothetical protein [Bacillus sp. 03113]|uniref:hypothetical protein n=1 Tax=Bacillus sp. 03113 TaxID=2578211 RepID=UPI00114293DB|nr:hypothetical protein [Bacillus sp. 03113]
MLKPSTNFKIINVSRDSLGRFMKLQLPLVEGEFMIRWALDEFTYLQIKQIFSTKYFDSLAKGYRYELVSFYSHHLEKTDNKTIYKGSIRCILPDRSMNIPFVCSPQFAGNMEWLTHVAKNLQDIEHLKWENFK